MTKIQIIIDDGESLKGITCNNITAELIAPENPWERPRFGSYQFSAQDIAFDELDMLIGKMKGVTTFKAINTLDGLTNTEKKILEKVFTAITTFGAPNASEIMDHILLSFDKGNRDV